jgi:hypothetical protein
MPRIHPRVARERARTATYPNRLVEADTIRAVDAAVFDKVRIVETHSVEAAQRLMERGSKSITDATSLTHEVDLLRIELQKRGAKPTPALAERYEKLRNRSRLLTQELDRHQSETEFHAKRCEDPEAAYVDMVERFPSLLPNIDM